MSNSWVVAGIAVLCLLSGFGGGSWVSGKVLDRCWEEAWQAAASKVRRGQLRHLKAGFVLRLRANGRPAWVLEGAPAEAVMLPRTGRAIGGSFDSDGTMIDQWHQDGPDEPRVYEWCPRCGCKPGEDCDGCYCHETHEAPAPLHPPGGAGQSVPRSAAGPEAASPSRDSGPGHSDDPLFRGLPDDQAFALIRFGFASIKSALGMSEPFALTAWQAT